MKFDFVAPAARYPAKTPRKFELTASVASRPALLPKKFELLALVAPKPALLPKKFELLALVAPDPAEGPPKRLFTTGLASMYPLREMAVVEAYSKCEVEEALSPFWNHAIPVVAWLVTA